MNERIYLLYVDNEKEKDDWIGAMGKNIVRSSKTFFWSIGNEGEVGENGAGGNRIDNNAGSDGSYGSSSNGYGYNDDNGGDDDDDSDYAGEGGVYKNKNNHPYFNDSYILFQEQKRKHQTEKQWSCMICKMNQIKWKSEKRTGTSCYFS